MTDDRYGAEPRADLATVTSDDALLTALSQGYQPGEADEVTALLAAWRADLFDGEPFDNDLADHEPADDEPVGHDADPPVPVVVPIRKVRRIPRLVMAAAAVLVVGGGLTLAAASGAKPDSPLWPITRVVFPQQADVAAAQHVVDLARAAAVQGRPADAGRLADDAEALIAKIRSPQDAQRLRTELDEVRRLIAGSPTGQPSLGPTTGPRAPAGTPAPNPGASGAAVPGGGPGAGPGTGPGGGGGQPPGPGLPLPSLPGLPLPTLPITLPPLPPLLGH